MTEHRPDPLVPAEVDLRDAVQVYVIEAGEFVKVGIAKDPEARVSTMQTGNPHKMRVAWSLILDDRRMAMGVERFAHQFLATFRRNGEWFACAPETARAAVDRGLQAYFGLA